MPLAAGHRLSHYEVLGPLGAGAMGEVYRARDTRLEREVALKCLPEGMAEDEERLRRFEREARTLASLSHPNVAHVYGIDREGDTRFIAMELVPGEDLAEHLRRRPMALPEVLEVCGQIADGLEAAHAAGVIHRDLKPANVRLTAEGRVKVLDFGLAKPVAPGSGEDTSVDSLLTTAEGRLLGTPLYMAPEQVRGKPVDRRADVWAFGCVVYECLTGRRPFAGESVMDVLTAVLEQEPDWTALPASTPHEVRELLERCLAKDARRRMRDVGDVRLLLEDAVRRGGGARPRAPGRSRNGGVRRLAIGLGAVGLAAVGLALWGGGPEPPRNPLDDALSWSKLTDGPAPEFGADISRDGKFVTFVSDMGGQFDAWVVQVGVGRPRNLTDGRKASWGLKIRDVWFDREAEHVLLGQTPTEPLLRVNVWGGDMTPHLAERVVNTAWDPAGERMVYHLSAEGDPVYVADADGQDPTLILPGIEGLHQHFATWSKDGRWIYVVRGFPGSQEMDLWRLRPDGTGLEQLTRDKRDVMFPAALDERTVLFVAQEANGAGPWLWVLDTETKLARRAGVGIEQYTSVAASLDGRRLVATVANPRSELWTIPLPGAGESERTEHDAAPLAELLKVGAAKPRFGSEGTLYFVSSGGLWRLRGDTRQEILPPTDAVALEPPAVSPKDPTTLAVVSRERGHPRLHLVKADVGVLGPALSDTIDVLGEPGWSPDGRTIAVGGRGPEGQGLYLFPVEGGEPRRLVGGVALNPVYCPDEDADLIVYAGPSERGLHPVVGVRPSDGATVPFEGVEVLRVGERVRFLPDGSAFVYMGGYRYGQDFWRVDLASGEKTLLARLADRGEMRAFDVDPSGGRIVFDRLHPNSDVVLIELE